MKQHKGKLIGYLDEATGKCRVNDLSCPSLCLHISTSTQLLHSFTAAAAPRGTVASKTISPYCNMDPDGGQLNMSDRVLEQITMDNRQLRQGVKNVTGTQLRHTKLKLSTKLLSWRDNIAHVLYMPGGEVVIWWRAAHESEAISQCGARQPHTLN
ncbi:hypothetical protein E2C01_096853 [Portunus trituberculatus]|uniref:Uncharacterized protein n=1 Tax=Portunus trituberculatus TaxID=210409 RepID=A0A5B7JYX1_PORTR|nr:hypothetical protein [Portunus trituberculatus]